MSEVKITPAWPEDRDIFLSLWVAFLEEHEAAGSDTRATPKTLEFYGMLFDAYVNGTIHGVALVASIDNQVVGALLWGGTGPLLMDTKDPMTVNGWGAYTLPIARRHGVSTALREHAIIELDRKGVTQCMGSALLSNKAGVETSRRVGFVPTMVFGTLDIPAEARKIEAKRALLSSDATLTDGFYWHDGDCPLCGSPTTGEAK